MHKITSSKCDLCNKMERGVEFYSAGTPVLFLCKVCEPGAYIGLDAALTAQKINENPEILA